jgi:hypothetical protein
MEKQQYVLSSYPQKTGLYKIDMSNYNLSYVGMSIFVPTYQIDIEELALTGLTEWVEVSSPSSVIIVKGEQVYTNLNKAKYDLLIILQMYTQVQILMEKHIEDFI